MKIMNLLFSCLLVLSFFTCSEKKSVKTENTEVEAPVEVQALTPTSAPVQTNPTYTRLPLDYGTKLLQEADGLEGTFYNSGKSISLWADNVKSVLAMMTEPAPLKLDNNIIGHIMYLHKGEKIAFVEISMKNGNNYVIYTIDDKKFYNTLTPQGLNFFQGLATPVEMPAPTK